MTWRLSETAATCACEISEYVAGNPTATLASMAAHLAQAIADNDLADDVIDMLDEAVKHYRETEEPAPPTCGSCGEPLTCAPCTRPMHPEEVL